MKKLILIAGLIITTNVVHSQKDNLINTKDLSALSFGAMPVVFASEDGPGLGVELNTRYALTEKAGASILLRTKSIVEENSSGYNQFDGPGNGLSTRNVFAVGTSIDYNLFKSMVLQLRGGSEWEATLNNAFIQRYIYGGGLIFKFMNSVTHRFSHSLRFSVDFETDNTIEFPILAADFSDFPYDQRIEESEITINTFSFQIGWNIQFNYIKKKE